MAKNCLGINSLWTRRDACTMFVLVTEDAQMVDEPDNMVLRLLREIRATLDDHSARLARMDARFDRMDARFDQVDARFDHVDKELEEVKFQVTYGLGVSSINNLKAREVDLRMTEFDRRLKTLEERADGEM